MPRVKRDEFAPVVQTLDTVIAMAKGGNLSEAGNRAPREVENAVKAFARALLERNFAGQKGMQTRAAEVLGVAQATVNALFNERANKGVGLPIVLRLSAYAGVTVDEVLGVSKMSPMERTLLLEGSDPLPMRGEAVAVARRWGFSPQAIADALHEVSDEVGASKPARWWFELIQERQNWLERTGHVEASPSAEGRTARVARLLTTEAHPSDRAKKVAKERRK